MTSPDLDAIAETISGMHAYLLSDADVRLIVRALGVYELELWHLDQYHEEAPQCRLLRLRIAVHRRLPL